ncbi:G patch domain-containing TGH-like isoform X1 [Chlorella sorokiniana]|uniref:G patch domain-containing TGH-like isoform X1 n=1 Tax=Chlorella sorokiniana TaxID=3076 RepID=A0A2P6TM64_CHLSO|nr:G patch domain-containing TGH-like isoform X1 [Chlorella sorokiniana]|eukprot:PRW45437.1 G patch domain-containing TGH-like isoform X1 [Chlorella sorokiniana]
MAESDEEDFHFWGTPVGDEEETRAGQHRKEVRDAAATRALPLHKQEVTDAEGRRRFHGAFTGGWSAGYFNTVGSKEGWQPSEFRSSRDARAAVQQSVEQFLDEDELEELRRTNLQTTQEYDTFGSTAAEVARRAAAEAAAERPSAIPGLVPEEVVAPVADSVGIRLLQKMGWRQGKGIGSGLPQQEEEGGAGGRPRRRWGQHATVAAENTQLYLLAPKTDVHGLGFDPFKDAEDFRRLKEQAREAARPKAAGEGRKRRRGIAFGSGVLDDEDGYGEGATIEDYVTHDDVEDYDESVQDDGLPRSRAPRVQRSGLGDRLAAKGYSFEIMDEEEEEPQRLLGWSGQERQRQYALPGRAETLMLQSREQQVKNSLIPGFVLATRTITFAYFPPPRLPPGYVPLHRPGPRAEAAAPAAVAKFAPSQAAPPADPELRQAIDSLAFFVAKNGVIFENMARQKQQKEGRWSFLSGGPGADYYRWKVHSFKSIIQPQQQRAPPRAIGQRSAPLSADERGALLGEQPLPASQQGWAAGAAGQATAGAAGSAEQPQALRRQLMNVAEADRQRLQQMLTRSFVAAESQEMLQPGAAAEAAAGLRPGAPAPPPRAPVNLTAGGIGKVVTEADLARPVDASAQAGGGGGLALQAAGGQGQQQGAAAPKRLPVRRVEEWRPAALLCKRFNVPDPYHGRPVELQMSRFKTDHLALPDTAAAVTASLNAVPAGAQDFLLPPTVAAALAEAEAKQLQQAGKQAVVAQPSGQLPSAQAAALAAQQAQQPPQDAAGAADAFLSSLSDVLGGGSEVAAGSAGAPGAPAPPLPPEQQPEVEATEAATAAAEAERPVDLFKAIFEDSDEELEEEQPPEQQQAAAVQQPDQQQLVAAVEQPPLPPGPPPPQQQPEEATFGFAKLRQPAPPPLPAGPPPPVPAGQAPQGPGSAAGAHAAAAAGAAAGIDDALKQRVQDALRALKKDKKEKRGSKKRKKERKEKRGKEKSRKHKKEGKERRRKEERRRRSGGSSDSGSSSGSSSDSQ